ncbi:IS701 family transposase [Gandjariella thermophila]|uniref:IS701 family transposase n=1 Tax=Gandjariella thermophila TaxID=1931992 RepID=UPI00353101EA
MEDIERWSDELARLCTLVGPRFGRSEPRERVLGYVRGLLAPLERKNGWTVAEHAGAACPDGMQRLLRTARWDADGVRDDVRGYVADRLGEPGGVLIADGTGFVKKGRHSAGVHRQYTGTSGKIDNCQVGVFLAYASAKGRALIDRELYLPESWTDDRARCRRAGIPDGVAFSTKPAQALAMIARALDAGMPAGWVTADEEFGQNPAFRKGLLARRMPFVLATRCDDRLPCPDRRRRQAKTVAAVVPAAAWERRSAGDGARGQRLYDWSLVELDPAGLPAGWAHRLLLRRATRPNDKGEYEVAYYRCAAPAHTSFAELIRVAGIRWCVEECFQLAKNEAGLDHYQVRDYTAWYRHITGSMLAAAFLTVTRSEHTAKGAT